MAATVGSTDPLVVPLAGPLDVPPPGYDVIRTSSFAPGRWAKSGALAVGVLS
jgi:hypothetical protein